MHSRRSRYSTRSPSPYYRGGKYSRSLSRTPPSRSGSRSRSWDLSDVANPGNTLYVTGLPSRISKMEFEDHFATEGKVVDIHLVVDPYTRESRGFGFVTMSRVEEAEKCIKYLDGSVLEGRAIKVEKAKRRRGRTPTPGRYLGPTASHARSRRSSSPLPYHVSRSSSSERENCYRRSRSPYSRRRYHSSLEHSRSPPRSVLPSVNRRWRSRSRTPRRRMYRRSYSRSISPRMDRRSPRSTYLAAARRPRRRSYSRSITPRRSSRRSSYRRSNSPEAKRRMHRRYPGSISPGSVSSGRTPSPSRANYNLKRGYSRESYSHSRSLSSHSRRSYSQSISPRKSSRSPRAGRRRSPVKASHKMKRRGHSRESYSHSRSLSS